MFLRILSFFIMLKLVINFVLCSFKIVQTRYYFTSYVSVLEVICRLDVSCLHISFRGFSLPSLFKSVTLIICVYEKPSWSCIVNVLFLSLSINDYSISRSSLNLRLIFILLRLVPRRVVWCVIRLLHVSLGCKSKATGVVVFLIY